MRISRDIYDAMNNALNYYHAEKWNGMVRVSSDRLLPSQRKDKGMKFTVAWACNGENSIEDAREFAKNVKEATDIAEQLTKMKLELVWEDSNYITTEEIYRDACNRMKTDLFGGLYSLHFEEEYIRIWGEKQEQ